MKKVIVTRSVVESEFDYQALDYYRLFDNTYLTFTSESVIKYLGDDCRIESLDNLTNSMVLMFDSVSPSQLQLIGENNTIVQFVEESVDYHTILSVNLIDCFVCFGSRSAYKLAHSLRTMRIVKPVYKIIPWVDTVGLNSYDDAPFGRLHGTADMDMRGMFRLMAAGVITIVPNTSPFNDVVVDGWNGIIYNDSYSELDNDKINHVSRSVSNKHDLSNRCAEFANIVLDKKNYIQSFDNVISGNTLDHSEPWIEPIVIKRTKWVIPRVDGEAGVVLRTPTTNHASFKEMRVSTLDKLLNYLINIPFDVVYVFDVTLEELDNDQIGNINKMINIIGDKIKDVHFCFKPPTEWSAFNRLSYLSVEEGVRQVL